MTLRQHQGLILYLFAVGACLFGCRERSQQQVVLYYSADDHIAEPIIERFENETGIDVLDRGDTEANKTTGLVEKLRAERDRPRADVFWSSEVFLTAKLAEEGVLEPYESGVTADWPDAYRDEKNGWYGFGCRARVVVYNTERVDEDEAPRTMHDLLDPKYRGRIVMARPQFGTTRGHMGLLVAAWGEERARAWLEGLEKNGVRLVDGNSTVVRMVARGEALIGLTDTDDVVGGQRNGWSIAASIIRHDIDGMSIGPMVIPNTVARVRGGPNQGAAEQLIDYLLGESVERELALSDSRNIPVRQSLASELHTFDISDPADTPYTEIAAAMDRAMAICDEILGNR